MFTGILALVALGSCLAQAKPFPDKALGLTSVTALDGSAANIRAERPSCFFFVTVDCPIANRYAPEISRIVKEYSRRQVDFYIVYVDPAHGVEAVEKHAREFGLKATIVRDVRHEVVRKVFASITPEVAVVRGDALLYRGRIDGSYVEHGPPVRTPYRKDLRIALDELLGGGKVTVKETTAVGCPIPPVGAEPRT